MEQTNQQPVVPTLGLSNNQLEILTKLAIHLQRALLDLRFNQVAADAQQIRQHIHLTSKLEMLKEIFGYDETVLAAAQAKQNEMLAENADNSHQPII